MGSPNPTSNFTNDNKLKSIDAYTQGLSQITTMTGNASSSATTTCTTSRNVNMEEEVETNEDTTNFIRPKKRRLSRPRQPQLQKIQTSNKFESLSENESADTDEESDTSESSGSTPKRFIKKQYTKQKNTPNQTNLQPIIISGRAENHASFIKSVQKNTTKKFIIKNTRNNTSLYLQNTEDKNNMILHLQQSKAEFHTYTDNNQKTHSFVIKGLGNGIDIENLKTELQGYITVNKIFKMNTKESPMYMLITDKETNINTLQKSIKYLSHTAIKWERVKNTKLIIQCHRCQKWGHATANCGHTPACLKCAQAHHTKDCQHKHLENPKCVNCGQGHIANSIECPEYLRALKIRKINTKQTQTIKDTHKPAPLPAHNAWAKYREEKNREEYKQTQQNEYPALPTQRTQSTRPTASTYSQRPPSQPSVQSQHNACIDEFDKLGTQVNMSEMLRALRDLNYQLQHCTTSKSKFTTYLNFLDNIQSYQI